MEFLLFCVLVVNFILFEVCSSAFLLKCLMAIYALNFMIKDVFSFILSSFLVT